MALHIECRFNKNSLLQCYLLAIGWVNLFCILLQDKEYYNKNLESPTERYHSAKNDKRRPTCQQSPLGRCRMANNERPRSQSENSSFGHTRQNLGFNNGSMLKKHRNSSVDENETHAKRYKNSQNNHCSHNSPQPTIVIDSPVETYKAFDWREKNGRIGVPFLNTCSVSTGYHSGGSDISMDHKLGEAENRV